MSGAEKLLTAIISCKKYANRIKAQQETLSAALAAAGRAFQADPPTRSCFN